MSESAAYLLPKEDGLPLRESTYTDSRYKLAALEYYIHQMNVSMANKPWISRNYIDLMAGPGKNRMRNMIHLGSPLIAITAPKPCDRFYFNDLNGDNLGILDKRIQASPYVERVQFSNKDANEVVYKICDEIDYQDRQAKYPEKWTSLNLAFLDPEGLELKWSTVERLASVRKMDLMILISTLGIIRNYGAGNIEIINEFFGTDTWLSEFEQTPKRTQRQMLVSFYLRRLIPFGYVETGIDPEFRIQNVRVTNSRNSEQYRIIFASKNKLGTDFWNNTTGSVNPPRLPGL